MLLFWSLFLSSSDFALTISKQYSYTSEDFLIYNYCRILFSLLQYLKLSKYEYMNGIYELDFIYVLN